MLLFVALICFASAAYYIGELVTAPSRERRNLLTRATQYGRMRVIHGRELPRFRDRVIGPAVMKLAAESPPLPLPEAEGNAPPEQRAKSLPGTDEGK